MTYLNWGEALEFRTKPERSADGRVQVALDLPVHKHKQIAPVAPERYWARSETRDHRTHVRIDTICDATGQGLA